MNFSQAMRLIWIDAALGDDRALLRRADLCGAFEISAPQASLDFRAYMALAPGLIVYDASAKGYRAGPAERAFDDASRRRVTAAADVVRGFCSYQRFLQA